MNIRFDPQFFWLFITSVLICALFLYDARLCHRNSLEHPDEPWHAEEAKHSAGVAFLFSVIGLFALLLGWLP